MSGILKALGVIILLSLTIRACGGKRFQEWEAEQNNKAKETGHVAESHQSDANEISPFRKELTPASKEIIGNYRSQHGRGTAGEDNLRRMLELNEEAQRKLRE